MYDPLAETTRQLVELTRKLEETNLSIGKLDNRVGALEVKVDNRVGALEVKVNSSVATTVASTVVVLFTAIVMFFGMNSTTTQRIEADVQIAEIQAAATATQAAKRADVDLQIAQLQAGTQGAPMKSK